MDGWMDTRPLCKWCAAGLDFYSPVVLQHSVAIVRQWFYRTSGKIIGFMDNGCY